MIKKKLKIIKILIINLLLYKFFIKNLIKYFNK